MNLYVKNLDESTDEESFRALFEPFGTITSVAAMKDEKGKCKGFGFVSFSSPDDATKAVTEMHLKVVKAAEVGNLLECQRGVVDKPDSGGLGHE